MNKLELAPQLWFIVKTEVDKDEVNDKDEAN